jgi:ATP-dependent DNA ligase
MLARLVRDLPEGDYIYEPKWDGFRCLAERDGERIELWSRHGRPLARYFPEIVDALTEIDPPRWTIDGELVVAVAGRLDFSALMARLHPAASRVNALAARTPACFVAFDLPGLGGTTAITPATPFRERRAALRGLLLDAPPRVFLTPATEDPALAARWLAEFCGGGLDGVVAKAPDLPYRPGARAMLKVKHERTVECVVAGMRVGGDPPAVTALMLGLHNATGELEHVGVAASFSRARRTALLAELAPLVTDLDGHPWERGFLTAGGALGRLRGAAGRWVPGMTMDWVALAPERVVEVAVTQVDGARLRHPAKFVRWRPDRDPVSCDIAQLALDDSPAYALVS